MLFLTDSGSHGENKKKDLIIAEEIANCSMVAREHVDHFPQWTYQKYFINLCPSVWDFYTVLVVCEAYQVHNLLY